MTASISHQISSLTDIGICRARAAGRAFYVCWTGPHYRPVLAVTTNPDSADQIVAICRPEAL